MMMVRLALCALVVGGAVALDAAGAATAGALTLAAVGAGARASQCTGSSSTGLADVECDAWVDFYDGAGGENWAYCSDKRLDPCACSSSNDFHVTCSGSHITEM